MLQFPLYIISFEDHDYECMPRSIFITESLDEAKNKALEFTLTKHTQFGDGFNITVNEVLNVQHDERTIFYFSNDERDDEEDRIKLMINDRVYNTIFDKKFEVLIELTSGVNIEVLPYTSCYWPE